MSKATVFSTAQFGTADDSSATGLLVASCAFNGTSDTAEAPDHIGCVVGFAVYNQRKDVTCDGIVKTKGSGLAANIGTVCTFANATSNSRTRLYEDLDVTPAAGAGVIITGANITPTANGFEGGSLTGIYHPFVDAGSTVTLT